MEKKTTYIGFVVTAEQKQALADVVAETHIAQAELLRMGLTMVLEKYQQAPTNNSVERGGYRDRKSTHADNSAVPTSQDQADDPPIQQSASITRSAPAQPSAPVREVHPYPKDRQTGSKGKPQHSRPASSYDE